MDIRDVGFRWVRRWWFGIIPRWELQYRFKLPPAGSIVVDYTPRWTEWKEVEYVREGAPEL